MNQEIEAQKARYAELKKERTALEEKIFAAQQPLIEDRRAKNRAQQVEKLNKLKSGVGPIAKEMSGLARALSGKL